MATAEEIVVKLTAQTEQLKAGMAEAATTVQTTQDAMAASVRSSMDTFAAFDAIQKGSIKTAQDAAAAQKVLNDARASMAYTDEELAEKEAILSAAMTKLPKEAEAASSGLAAALTRNSRTAYSASALISDALTGQFSRSRREVAALANETGVMAKALQFALSPVGLFAEALLAIGVGVIAADDHYEKFEQTILRTGDIIGMSAGELQGMANDVGLVTGHTFEAVDAVQALGASGRFTGDQLRVASEAAVNFSEVTGEKVGKAAEIIESLQEKPAKAIAEVNDQFHFLTQGQADLIEKLLATGQNAQAAAVAVQAFHDAMASRADEMEQHTSALSRGWHSVSNWIQQAAENEAEYIEVSTGGGDATEKLSVAQKQLASDERIAAHWWSDRFGLMTGVSNAQIEKEKQVVAQLEAEKRAADGVAQAKAKAAQATAEQFDKATHGGKHGREGGSGQADEQAFQQAQYAAQQQGHELSLAEQKAWWQKRLTADQAGGAADANATAAAMRHVVELQKQMDRQSEESGKEAARKRAQAAKDEARKEEEASKKAAAAKLAADEQSVENVHTLATARIAASVQAAQTDYAQGKITAQELYNAKVQGLNLQLAADRAYYQAKEALAQGDVAAVEKFQGAIAVAEVKTNQKILADQKQLAAQVNEQQRQIERTMEQSYQRIGNSVMRSLNGIIFDHQTLRNAVLQIGQQILETEERNLVETVAKHLAAEQAKTASTVMGNAQRNAADEIGQARSLLIQGEAAIKWIMTEAAKAAAGAFNALVSIPYVGPFLAVGASVAAFAAVAKLVGSVASAEGGWERVPADGMMTQLHKDEMVLPKHVADPIRNMARGGGNGGGVTHVHLNGMDGKSLASFLKRNPRAFQMALAHAGRNGW